MYTTRKKHHNSIIAAEGVITVALADMHRLENKVLDYLSNAQGAMQNLHQIKRAAELSAIEIPKNMKLLLSSIPRNIKGTAIAALVSEEVTDATLEAASLYPLMAQLVSSGSYNVSDGNGGTQKKKVNLLDASQRYYIANEIVTKLENINMDLWLLAWQVRTYGYLDIIRNLAPDTWINIMAGDAIVRSVIQEYKYL